MTRSGCKKPGVAFWATVVVVVGLVAYPLSFGPIIWFDSRGLLPEWTYAIFRVYYAPLDWAAEKSVTVVQIYAWYTGFWRADPPVPRF